MKTVSQLLILFFINLSIISCSINEKITFNSNGSISYSYIIDASKFMSFMPDSDTASIPIKDSIFSFATIIENSKDSISKLPIKEQEELKALAPLKLQLYQDEDKKEFFIKMSGDFDDAKSFNSALKVMSTYNNLPTTNQKTDIIPSTTIEWNGHKMARMSFASAGLDSDSAKQYMIAFFAEGKFNSKLIFPKKIKKINTKKNDPSVIISKDEKSILLECNAMEYLMFPEKINLVVELEK